MQFAKTFGLQFLMAAMMQTLKRYKKFRYFAETRLLPTFNSVFYVHTFQGKLEVVALEILKVLNLKQNLIDIYLGPKLLYDNFRYGYSLMQHKAVNFIFLTSLFVHFDRPPNISVSIKTKTTVRSPRSASGPT
jgi:hypothetical protein